MVHGERSRGAGDIDDLHVWFPRTGSPPGSPANLVFWSQLSDVPDVTWSLPLMLRETPRWREAYRSWLNAWALSLARGDRQPDAPDLVWWWMNIPTTYAFIPGSLPYESQKLWALTHLIVSTRCDRVVLWGAPDAVRETLSRWLDERKISATWSSIPSKDVERQIWRPTRRQRIRASVFIQSVLLVLLFLRYRLAGKRVRVPKTRKGLVVVDYLAHMSEDHADLGYFTSKYWHDLPSLLQEESGKGITWLHFDTNNGSFAHLRTWRKRFRTMRMKTPSEVHVLVEDQWGWASLARALRSLRNLSKLSKESLSQHRIPRGPMGEDMSSLVAAHQHGGAGATALARRAMWRALMSEIAGRVSEAKGLIFLMEGQAWEAPLVYEWQARSQAPSIAVSHGIIHPNDTRFFRPYDSFTEADFPTPDHIVVVGDSSRDLLLSYGADPSRVHVLEALRFPVTQESPQEQHDLPLNPPEILVLGEYVERLDRTLIELARQLALDLPFLRINYRPHPAQHARARQLDDGSLHVSWTPSILDDLRRATAALSTNSSFASVDAYMNGIPLALAIDPEILDRFVPPIDINVKVCLNAKQLAAWITELGQPESRKPRSLPNLLCRDATLRRWQRFLQEVLD